MKTPGVADASQHVASNVLGLFHSSAFILVSLVAIGVLAGLLFRVGVIGFALKLFGTLVRWMIRTGFQIWEYLLSWAEWPLFLGTTLVMLGLGWVTIGLVPPFAILFGSLTLFMGVTACLAYMAIDLERYDVVRGYKALHDPGLGQAVAEKLVRYGDILGVPLLAAAAVSAVGGFALFNMGLYETVGRTWYAVVPHEGVPGYFDFLAYSLINLYQLVDVLDLAGSYNGVQITHLRPTQWPASTLLAAFKIFFTLILLQQLFASVRKGQALAEAIADFWSPHPSVHERARNSLHQHGAGVVQPLLNSLRTLTCLTKEQRDRLPQILADIGPACAPTLTRYLSDPNEGVRAVASAALGHLSVADAVPALVRLASDPSELVRQAVVAALGTIGENATRAARQRSLSIGRRRRNWIRWKRNRPMNETPAAPTADLAVDTLATALTDNSSSVRIEAARALGQIGTPAARTSGALATLLGDADETVRCGAAEALGKVGAEDQIPALAELLKDSSPVIKEAAARALGSLKGASSSAVPELVALLQDREPSVRQAVAEAIGQIGTLSEEATTALVEGLTSRDTAVRAQTAEALGAIGSAAEDAAPALVEALTDGNDRVRAEAASALGKIGEAAADAAVPGLVRALRDKDSWVSALAAEALGEIGEAAEEAVPALVRSLRHINPLVRANAAEALGKLGPAAADALPALVTAAKDADGNVRSRAVCALSEVAPADDPAPCRVALDLLADADSLVRAAAVEALAQHGAADESIAAAVLPLLEDANDQVKFQVIRAAPKLLGPAPEVVDGLIRRLLEDDSAWIREGAAAALGQLGSAAVAAGPSLLRAAQTGETAVRLQAVRAMVMIQPPEAVAAFSTALQDADPEIRKIASAGWIKAGAVPDDVVPALVDALRDPEMQVRANAAHLLGRLDALPAEAVPLLIDCAAHPNDGLRMNAAVALREGRPEAATEVFAHLLDDSNVRIRLIAAGAILTRDPADVRAATVVTGILSDPVARLRAIALEIITSLGQEAWHFLDALKLRVDEEDDPEIRERMRELVARCEEWKAAQNTAPTEEGSTFNPLAVVAQVFSGDKDVATP
ncbi:HEAT repeat domain-containing protein [Fimbriiglobus ruber]|uniref:HEAT repeat protein n=1 Tax=Fimbriiglobus ruber TaxID=1908690 RepID=A0A225E4H0_9BACT|nr:HEAT repeat domain-containing protein [Fimbriiglobus ruber]OWK43585.1 HEAT repeat protein [Fimbriiglobus ruber]